MSVVAKQYVILFCPSFLFLLIVIFISFFFLIKTNFKLFYSQKFLKAVTIFYATLILAAFHLTKNKPFVSKIYKY